MKKISLFILVLAVASACAVQKKCAKGVDCLAGTEWMLQTLSLDGVAVDLVGDAPTLRFDTTGEINGFTGCNRYFGAYKLTDESLVLDPKGSTKAFCEESMDVEKAFLEALVLVKNYEFGKGETLKLASDDEKMTMTLAKK